MSELLDQIRDAVDAGLLDGEIKQLLGIVSARRRAITPARRRKTFPAKLGQGTEVVVPNITIEPDFPFGLTGTVTDYSTDAGKVIVQVDDLCWSALGHRFGKCIVVSEEDLRLLGESELEYLLRRAEMLKAEAKRAQAELDEINADR